MRCGRRPRFFGDIVLGLGEAARGGGDGDVGEKLADVEARTGEGLPQDFEGVRSVKIHVLLHRVMEEQMDEGC